MADRRHSFWWDLLTHLRRCPWCGSIDVRPSTHPLRLLTVLRCETWRCRGCGRRFPVRPKGADTPAPAVETTRGRRPAGALLRPLDDALASLLKPAPIDDERDGAGSMAPQQDGPPRRKADDQS